MSGSEGGRGSCQGLRESGSEFSQGLREAEGAVSV